MNVNSLEHVVPRVASALTITIRSCLLAIAAFELAGGILAGAQPTGTSDRRYEGWEHSGSLWILTTPEGADLPAACLERDFPLLVRLNRHNFDFRQAKRHGEDLRFSDSRGETLAYQIDEWDVAGQAAAIWVRIPLIKGKARQEIRMYWGKPDALSESGGAAVFNAENGFRSVMHLDGALKDEAGSLIPFNAGSTSVRGIIGTCRHCTPGTGVNGGEHITNYPYSDGPFTSEAWFRPEAAGTDVLGWGRYATRYNGQTGDGNEVVISIGSPPRIGWSSDGPGGAWSSEPLAMRRWHHVAATYVDGTSRIYLDGKLAGSNFHRGAMSVVRDIGLKVGGMRGGFNYAGDIDEVRISHVARSPDWIKLEYENQKDRQTLVGSLVQPGSAFTVSTGEINIDEGKTATVTAEAGGAEKVYWTVKRDGAETIVAVDQCSYTLDAGRVVADTSYFLEFKAVYPGEVKVRRIPVNVKNVIPEPIFTLRAPSQWNGREPIEVVPEIDNLAAMQASGAGELHYAWSVSDGAVLKQVASDRLILKRSQCTGPITVRLALNNGGADFAATASIQVTEPKRDPWVQRAPGKDERPEDNQLFARDDKNEGTLYYNGTLESPASAPAGVDSVFLKVFADDRLLDHQSQRLGKGKSYAFTVKLSPGLVKYRLEFGVQRGAAETVLRTVKNLVCGDAYLIDGQSNAEATGPNNGPEEDPVTPMNDWIRSYGNQLEGSTRGGWGNAVRTHIWGKPNYGCHQIGAWGMVLAKRLVEKYRIPICIINGAYGGTPIWQHQANPTNHYDSSGDFYQSPYKIYGCLLTRVTAAHLTHGIRGIFWHQGENDSNSGAPTGDYNYKSYQQYFVDMSAAWKQDYPNLQHYYVFQVWPAPCAMGPKDDELREAQRTLPRLYSNLRIMSTVGIVSKATGRGMCHYDLDGYAQMAELMSPLVEQDNYGLVPRQPITAPNLRRAWFTSAAQDEIALDFGQPVVWNDEMKRSFHFGRTAQGPVSTKPAEEHGSALPTVAAGTVLGNILRLKLTGSGGADTISYLSGSRWDGNPKYLVRGANGIAALTFCDVGIAASEEAQPARVHFEPTIESLKQYETPEWFEDAKLGIYMHWGPQSIPGVATTWYARWIYEQGSEAFKYHCATYGHPSKFGYKDICKLFKAPKFDQAQADRLVELYKRIGARYVVPVAVHHDNFDMWDSKYQPRWNSVATAGKDVVGMWKKATVKYGLHLGVASHCARTYRWLQGSHGSDRSGPLAGVPYDGQDPQYADLYGVKWRDDSGYPDFWYEQRSDVGPPEFEKNFQNRMEDLMDKYHPDLYYTDGGIPFKQAGLNVLAHFYNENQKWNGGRLQAVATIKLDWTPNVAANNYEFSYPDSVQHYHWQSDKTMGADWFWIRNATSRYMSAASALHMLIDTVSKNGNLLLNVPLTPDGELEPETVAMLTEMGRCLDVIGKAIFSTRCWVVADDGPGSSVRFTRSKQNTVLYLTNLGWSNDVLQVRTLASTRFDLKSLRRVSMLGLPSELAFRQTAAGLIITQPPRPAGDYPAYAYQLEFDGPIPRLKAIND